MCFWALWRSARVIPLLPPKKRFDSQVNKRKRITPRACAQQAPLAYRVSHCCRHLHSGTSVPVAPPPSFRTYSSTTDSRGPSVCVYPLHFSRSAEKKLEFYSEQTPSGWDASRPRGLTRTTSPLRACPGGRTTPTSPGGPRDSR